MVKLYLIVQTRFYGSWLLPCLSGACSSICLEGITVNNQREKTQRGSSFCAPHKWHVLCLPQHRERIFQAKAFLCNSWLIGSAVWIWCVVFPLGGNSRQEGRLESKAAGSVSRAVKRELAAGLIDCFDGAFRLKKSSDAQNRAVSFLAPWTTKQAGRAASKCPWDVDVSTRACLAFFGSRELDCPATQLLGRLRHLLHVLQRMGCVS